MSAIPSAVWSTSWLTASRGRPVPGRRGKLVDQKELRRRDRSPDRPRGRRGGLSHLGAFDLGCRSATALAVVLVAKLGERGGALLASVVMTFPMNAGPGFLFVALEQSPAFVRSGCARRLRRHRRGARLRRRVRARRADAQLRRRPDRRGARLAATLALATIALPISLVSALTAIAVGSGVVVLLGTSRVRTCRPRRSGPAGICCSARPDRGPRGPDWRQPAGSGRARRPRLRLPDHDAGLALDARKPLRARSRSRRWRASQDHDLCRLLPDAPLRRRAAPFAAWALAGRRDPDRVLRALTGQPLHRGTQLPPAEQASPPGRPVSRHPASDR